MDTCSHFFPHYIPLYLSHSLFLLYHPSSSSSSLSITSYLDHFIYAFQPWHVTSYLFCGCDLVKIMSNELFDQNLLTTRHRAGLDKPRPHLSALFQLWSHHLSILIHLFVDAMIHLLFHLLSKKKDFFSCTGMLLIMKNQIDWGSKLQFKTTLFTESLT